MTKPETRRLRVAEIRSETAHVKSLLLEAEDGSPLPGFEAGSHVDLHLPNGASRQYSLLRDPAEGGAYHVGVLRERESRGGSIWIHENLDEGDVVQAGMPRNNFPLVPADRYLMIAGGIGVTPLLSMGAVLHRTGANFDFHYCTRDRESTPYLDRISDGGWLHRVTVTHDGGNPANGLDIGALLAEQPTGAHLYCCGPAGLMNAVRDASAHWLAGTVHFEWFVPDEDSAGDQTARAFTVLLARSGQELEVPADASIVQVLSDHGIVVDTVCEEGICGTCITDVLEGEPEHHDSILTDEERDSNTLMTICCSRAKGDRLVLDL